MSQVVEEESGTFVSATAHPHSGYYAGDFSAVPFRTPDLGFLLTSKEYQA